MGLHSSESDALALRAHGPNDLLRHRHREYDHRGPKRGSHAAIAVDRSFALSWSALALDRYDPFAKSRRAHVQEHLD